MAEDITTPDPLVIQSTPVTQAQFNTQLQVINSFKKVINKQFTNLNDKATERVLRKFKLIEFYRSITNIILTKVYMWKKLSTNTGMSWRDNTK